MHSPHDELDDDRLVRYLRGECSSDELRAIAQWVAEAPARGKRLDLLRQGWSAAGGQPPRGDVDRGWAAIADQLDGTVESPSRRGHPARVLRVVPGTATKSRWRLAARAAGIVLAIGTAALFAWKAGRQHQVYPAVHAGAMREITTRPGQRADVYLSDGTHVVLGVASRLRFPATFGASRDVELLGQAYFDVTHDARPFDVHVSRAVVRDLGTKFDVRAYAGTENVAVVVTQGAVMLKPLVEMEAQRDSAILMRSDAGFIALDGKLTVRRGVDADAYVGWTRGKLMFRQTPAAEAVAQINRWYGADVRLGDATLAGLALTMSITNESASDAVRILAHALDARVEQRGRTAILYARDKH